MSDTLSSLLTAPDRHCFLSGTITCLTGEAVSFSGAQAMGFSMSEGASGGKLLGGAFSAACSLTLNDADRLFTAHRSFHGAQVAVRLCADTFSAPLCVFTVQKTARREGDPRLTLSGTDALGTAFEGVLEDTFTYPLTLGQLARHIAALAGFSLHADFPNASFSIPARPDWGDLSLRQALAHIACAAGCFACISREGELVLKPVRSAQSPFIIAPDATLRREYGEASFGPLTGLLIQPAQAPRDASPLTVSVDDTPLGGYNALQISGNPLFPYEGAHTEALAQALLTQLQGWKTTKARLTWRGDPAVSLGDPVRIQEVDGTFADTVVTSQQLSFSRGFSMQTEGDVFVSPPAVGHLFTPAGALNASRLAGSINGALIQNGTLAASALMAGSVTAQQLAARSVTSEKIDAGAITAAHLQADVIQSRHLSADALDAVSAHIEEADIDWAHILGLSAATADLVNAHISQADIDWAQIKDLSAGTALITQGVSGQLFISRLAVTEANMLSLTVGQLMVRGADGAFYAVGVDENGAIVTQKKLVNNADVADLSLNAGQKLMEGTVTAACLNAREIFGDSALIRQLIAANLDVDTLFARDATIRLLNAADLRGNDYLRMMVGSRSRTYSQWEDPALDTGNVPQEGDLWDRNMGAHTWQDASSLAWGQEETYPWSALSGSLVYVRRNGQWMLISDMPSQLAMGTQITQTEEKITLQAQGLSSLNSQIDEGVPRVKNSALTIDANGIDMTGGEIVLQAGSALRAQSGGTVEIFAQSDDSYLKFGGTEENPHFSVGEGGNVRAAAITADAVELTQGSLLKLLPSSLGGRMFIGTQQPQGHGILWLRPNAQSSVDYSVSQCRVTMHGHSPSAQITLSRAGSALAGSQCTYGLKFRIYNYSGTASWTNLTVTARRGDGEGQEIILYSGSPGRIRPGDYVSVDTLVTPGAAQDNLTAGTGLILTVSAAKSASSQARFDSDVILRCTNDSSAGAQACDLFYLP